MSPNLPDHFTKTSSIMKALCPMRFPRFAIAGIVCFILCHQSVSAQFGKAMLFSRSNTQYISVPHSSSINLVNNFTIEARINYTGPNATIIDKGNYDYLLQVNANSNGNKLGMFDRVNSVWVYSTGAVPQNVPSHVAVTYANGNITFYINGVASGTAFMLLNPDNQPMNIGRQAPSNCQCNTYNGTIDELRLWSVVRTPAQLQANMNTAVASNSTGLAAYYQFNEGSGTTVTDATGNGNTGTLVNGPQWVNGDLAQYSAPGTFNYVVPAGVAYLSFQAWGAGANASNQCSGNSGGGGAFAQSKRIPVTAGQSVTVRVGTAGATNSAGDPGQESYVMFGAVKKLGANGGTVGNGGAASTVATFPDLDFSYKGGNAGSKVTYNDMTPNYNGASITIFGGGGASGGPGGAGGNGSNATQNTYNPAGGTATGEGGYGGGGAVLVECNGGSMLNAAQNAGGPGGGGGAPYATSGYGKGVGGKITVTTCPSEGSIGRSHTVPY
ncbi:MAG: LamG domain-containing protein, partial [Sphingobacteriales bacterium]